jgi:hypothetical protein
LPRNTSTRAPETLTVKSGDTEIGDNQPTRRLRASQQYTIDCTSAEFAVKEQVTRLQVAMHDIMGVDVAKTASELACQLNAPRRRNLLGLKCNTERSHFAPALERKRHV